MGEKQFKDAAGRIASLFENCSAAAAVAEQKRVNQSLAPRNLIYEIQGRPGGNHLAFRLYRSDTRPHAVVFDINMWFRAS